jgi:tetratricopeptide (TPR) repeat protein
LLRVESASRPAGGATGHRFGRWLEVDAEARALAALEVACLSEQVGEAEAAIDSLSQAIADAPCASLYQARGALYLGAGFPRAAAGDFQKAVALDPSSGRSWYALGHAYEVLGLEHQALEALEHARALGPVDGGLCLSLARVHRSLGHVGRAAMHYEQALRLLVDPELETLVEACSLALEDASRADEVAAMRERIESCLHVRPSEDACLLRALLGELHDRPQESIMAAFRTLEMSSADLSLLTRFNLLALQILDPETGAECGERLLESEPDDARKAALARCLDRS